MSTPARRRRRGRGAHRATVSDVLIGLSFRAWVAACFLGGVMALTAVVYLPSDLRSYRVAEQLRAGGSTALAHTVRVDIVRSKGGALVDEVVATFTVADGRDVRSRLTGTRADDGLLYDDTGWQPPADRSIYRTPLRVTYLPADPGTAMATADLDEWTTSPWRENGTVVAVGIAPAALTGLALLLHGYRSSRPTGGRRRGGRPDR